MEKNRNLVLPSAYCVCVGEGATMLASLHLYNLESMKYVLLRNPHFKDE